MKYTVITTFNQKGLQIYGQKMIDTFEQHWPDTVDLVVYAENCTPVTRKPNVKVLDIVESSKSLKRFTKRHKNNPKAHGNPFPEKNPDAWTKKTFRWEAVRFSFKVFATGHAAKNFDTDWLIWLDGDTHTHTNVSESFLSRVCPNNSFASYLGRGGKYHSECGWVAYNCRDANFHPFVDRFVGMYDTDEIFNYREWHDSFIWDVARNEFTAKGVNFYNLNPSPDTKGLAGHPFINSDLGLVMDHKKGERKHRGHSNAREVVTHKDHPYWQRVMQQ